VNGKLSERFWISKQVRVDEELGARVRATRAGRSLQGHIAYLLDCGLNYIELENRYGKNHLLAHLASQPVMPVSGRDFRHEYPANTEATQDVTRRHARGDYARPKPMRRTA
jgi:hypothetical protein